MEIECQYRGVTKSDEGVVFWITVLPPDPPLSRAQFAGGASGIAASIDLTSGASSKGCSTDCGWGGTLAWAVRSLPLPYIKFIS